MGSIRPIDALRRFWWVVVLFTIAGAIVGGLPAPQKAADSVTRYSASHTILVSSSSDTGSIYNDPLAFNQIQLFATTGEVPERAAESLGYDGSPAALAAQVTVTADQQNGALRISTTQSTGDDAEQIANTFADELVKYLAERQDTLREDRLSANLNRLDDLETQITDAERKATRNPDDRVVSAELDALSRQYSVVFEQYNALQADQGQLVLTTLERAQAVAITEQGLSAPRSRTGRGLLGGFAGLAVGAGVALLLARSDRKIRSREQAESILALRASAIVPNAAKQDLSTLVVRPDRHDPLSDSYRTLRSVVKFHESSRAMPDGLAVTIVVVSPGQGDGKTSVSANLAASFVEAGERTLAVNTDFRRPALSRRLVGYEPTPRSGDLHALVNGPLDMAVLPTDAQELVLLDLSGMPGQSPSDLARATARIIPRLSRTAEAIVVDTSPVGATAEVLEFVPMADVVLVVVRLGHTSILSAQRTIEMVRTLSSGDLLLVLVGGDSQDSSYYYYQPSKPRNRFGRRTPDPTSAAPPRRRAPSPTSTETGNDDVRPTDRDDDHDDDMAESADVTAAGDDVVADDTERTDQPTSP